MLELFDGIRDELQAVEEELRSFVQCSDPLITETSVHLLNAGGKRLRPALSIFGGKFYNFHLEKVLPLAVALELIHMATLVHDDVVDSSLTRRGIPTVKAKWGNSISTHVGTYLFARSLVLISRYEDQPLISRVLSNTSVKMCEGEIQQIAGAFDLGQSFKDYFYRIKRKTALLIAASVQLGAVACGAPAGIHQPLRRYGHFIGMAFQLTDDILDMVADQQQLGKPVGSDLREGIITMPVIYALAESNRRDRLRELVGKTVKDEGEIKEAIDIVRECGAIEYSFKVVRRYVLKAKEQLAGLPGVPARAVLLQAADFIGARKF
jgi:heptaprenyl diphosphate synthase